MGMKIDSRMVKDVVVMDIQGQITIGEGDEKLKETIDKFVAEGKKKILVNLKKVSFMDSSGIGELVGCYTTVSRAGGKLKLENLNEKVHDLLEITQLIRVFEIHDDEQKAIASYK